MRERNGSGARGGKRTKRTADASSDRLSLPHDKMAKKKAKDERRQKKEAKRARQHTFTRSNDQGEVIPVSKQRFDMRDQEMKRHREHALHIHWARNHNKGAMIPLLRDRPMGLFEHHDEELRDAILNRKEKEKNGFVNRLLGRRVVVSKGAKRRRDTAHMMQRSVPVLAQVYAKKARKVCRCSHKSVRNVLGIDMKGIFTS